MGQVHSQFYKKNVSLWHHRRSPKDSKPISWYECSDDVPWIAPVIAMNSTSYWIFLIWRIFENPCSTTASKWGIITYIASKRQMFGKAPDTTQPSRKSSTVTRFFTLATALSSLISSFLIDFFCKIFAFLSNNLLLSEFYFLRNSSPTLLFCEFM